MKPRRRSLKAHRSPRPRLCVKPASPPPPSAPAVSEVIDISDNSDDDDVDESNKPSTSTVANADLTEVDPTLMSDLVKEHCLFCLTRKTRTLLTVSLPASPIEVDGYELLRRYIGVRTVDCLNDIFDAVVFSNRVFQTAEFPAPLLCGNCVQIVRELDDLHNKLEFVQKQILLRVQRIRKLVTENGSSIKNRKQPSERRLQFESELVESCNGSCDTAEMMVAVLDRLQEVFQEETHDQIEIHLEHLEHIDSFSVDTDLAGIGYQPPHTVKLTVSASTQTDNEQFNVKVFKVSIDTESEDEATPVPFPELLDDDLMDTEFHNDDDASPGSPQEMDIGTEEPNHESDVNSSAKPTEDVTEEGNHNVTLNQIIEVQEVVPTPVTSTPTSYSNQRPIPPQLPAVVHESCNGFKIIRERGQNSSITILKDKADPKKNTSDKNAHLSLEGSARENSPEIEEINIGENETYRRKLNTKKGTTAKKKKSSEDEETESDSDEESDSSESEDRSEDESSSDTESSSEDDSSSSSEDDNIAASSSKPRPFKCGLCKTRFIHRTDVNRHIRAIHKKEPYLGDRVRTPCPECSYVCMNLTKLKRHMKDAHQMEMPLGLSGCTYRCVTCGYSKDGIKLVPFINHLREHEGPHKTMSCEDCLQNFTTQQMYQMHPCPQTGRLPGSVTVRIENFDNLRKESGYTCRYCTTENHKSEKSLLEHFKTKHKGGRAFLCEICGGDVAFESKNELKTHMIETHGAVKYKCRICEKGSKEFIRYEDWHVHLNFEHFSGYVACTRCPKRFTAKEKFEVHLKSHEAENKEQPKCEICKKYFASQKTLETHLRKHREEQSTAKEKELDENDQPVEDGQSTEKSYPLSHRPRKNCERKSFTCMLCDYNCSTSNLYRRHMQNEHGILIERKTNARTYQCDLCNYTSCTVRLNGFVQHLREHESSKKRLQCEDCFENFTTKQLYQLHPCPQTGKLPGTAIYSSERCKHNNRIKNYTCRFCDIVFTSEAKIQKHCSEEHKKNAFSCDVCRASGKDVSYYSFDLLKTHLITQHDAVPYKCRLCIPTKVFDKFYDIFVHENIEHFNIFHECPQCGKRYAERSKLEIHMSVHSNDRKHICNFCGTALKSVTTLRRHIDVHHSEIPKKYACSICSKKFRGLSNLSRHNGMAHGDKRKKSMSPTRSRTRQQRTPTKSPPKRQKRAKCKM